MVLICRCGSLKISRFISEFLLGQTGEADMDLTVESAMEIDAPDFFMASNAQLSLGFC